MNDKEILNRMIAYDPIFIKLFLEKLIKMIDDEIEKR